MISLIRMTRIARAGFSHRESALPDPLIIRTVDQRVGKEQYNVYNTRHVLHVHVSRTVYRFPRKFGHPLAEDAPGSRRLVARHARLVAPLFDAATV